MSRRAFTLVELLLAVFILGIGVLGVAALLPSAIALQQRANDDLVGPIIAENAIAVIRSKLNPEMFGTMEEFGIGVDIISASRERPQPQSRAEALPLTEPIKLPGDWGWKRPGVIISSGNTPPESARLLGALDIFGGLSAPPAAPIPGLSVLSEAPVNGLLADIQPAAVGVFFGIPFNTRVFARTPAIVITQGERCYPMVSPASYPQPRPQYVWDCMFRRFEGRVLVAIFVYRVSAAGGDLAGAALDVSSGVDVNAVSPYRVGLRNTDAGPNGTPPPIPMCVALDQTPLDRWRYGGIDLNPATTGDNSTLPGTFPAVASIPFAQLNIGATWQAPGQWIVDEFNTVHKVASGRRTNKEGPVVLTRPVPELEPTPALFGAGAGGGINDANMRTVGIRRIWFVPTRDENGLTLQPVYAVVREL